MQQVRTFRLLRILSTRSWLTARQLHLFALATTQRLELLLNHLGSILLVRQFNQSHKARLLGLLQFSHLVSAGSNNAQNVKGTPGQIYGWNIYNNAAYPIYVKLWNKATAPIPGTDTPVRTIGVQAGTQFSHNIGVGMVFSLGIGISITKGIADADNTAVLANDCAVDLSYL